MSLSSSQQCRFLSPLGRVTCHTRALGTEKVCKCEACSQLHAAPTCLACSGDRQCIIVSHQVLPAPSFLLLAFPFPSLPYPCLCSQGSPKLIQAGTSAVDETSPHITSLRHWGTPLSEISAFRMLPVNCFTVTCQGCPMQNTRSCVPVSLGPCRSQ